jgi:hypothetical protein
MPRVALDRVVHLSRQPFAARGKRGEHPADLGTTDAELSLGLSLQVLVGQLRGVVAEQRQDVDGGRAELGDESVGEGGRHPARGRTGCVGFYSSGVGDGATGLLAVQGVGEGPQRGGEFTDRAM